jgi:mRNA-degrading endonuclease toxin of MazEF toxin-antitoxin module
VDRGEIWWVEYPPTAVYKEKDPHMILLLSWDAGTRDQVTGALVTGTARETDQEVELDHRDGMKKRCVVNLDTLYTLPTQWIKRKERRISVAKMREVERAIHYALGIELPCGVIPHLPLR